MVDGRSRVVAGLAAAVIAVLAVALVWWVKPQPSCQRIMVGSVMDLGGGCARP